MSRKADASHVDLVSLQGADAKLLAGPREMPFACMAALLAAMDQSVLSRTRKVLINGLMASNRTVCMHFGIK